MGLSSGKGSSPHLLSGEVHYFRLPPSEWRNRILKAKEAGLHAISTYIPWNWHEISEGVFDFSGDTHPQRNLELFLETAEEEDMLVIAKPGPYICAEWIYGGIPPWLLKSRPEIRALDSSGKPTKWLSKKAPVVSYLHPTYLEFAERWMKKVSEVIKKYEASRGGCVFIVQVDNESCYGFHFSPFDTDYNPVVVGACGKEGLYHEWLKTKFPSIEQLNMAYGTKYTDFSEVQPPRKLDGRRNLPAVLDWIEFKEQIIATFLHKMAESVRSTGVDVLLITNDFFISLLSPPVQVKSRFLVDAVNLYPHYLDDESFLAVVNYLELFKGCQPGKPLIVAELQAGWFSYKTSKNTLHALARLAHVKGARITNFYMFSGGVNPKGFGTTGKLYFKDAPVSPEGRKTDKYYTIKLFASLVETSPPPDPTYDLHVAYYHKYSAAEIADGCDVHGRKYRAISTSFRRLLLSLLKNGLSYSITPIEFVNPQISPLLFNAFDFLNEEGAEKLVHYVEEGGTLILTPQTPSFGERNRSPNALAEALGVTEQNVRSGVVELASQKLEVRSATVFKVKEAEPLAILNERHLCGFRSDIGKGKVIQLGFTPSFSQLEKLVPNLRPVCRASNVMACLSRDEKGYSLFVCNFERKDVEGVVHLCLPDYSTLIRFSLPARGSAVWPLRRKFNFGELVYATAEIVEVSKEGLTFWAYEGSRVSIELKTGENLPLHGDASRHLGRTMFFEVYAKRGENMVAEKPLKLVVIGVRRPELEGVRERAINTIRKFAVKRVLGY
ncbi:MAG: beta-galactosidase [Candidatus Jordarchaeales archaeon]